MSPQPAAPGVGGSGAGDRPAGPPRFSIATLAPADRAAALREISRTATVPFSAQPIDRGRPVELVHGALQFHDVGVTESTFANWIGTRSAAQARDLSEPRLVLAVGSGESALRLEQGDRRLASSGPALLPFWSISAWALEAEHRQTVRSISVPLAALGLPHLIVRDLLARDLGHHPLGRMLAHHLAGAMQLDDLGPTESSAVERVTIDLLRSLLAAAAGADDAGRESLRRTLAARILLHIEANLGDHSLSPESIAARFGISRRYLYLLMHQLEISLADLVRRGRLARAAEALSIPSNAAVSIAAIGRAHGFVDASSFSRAFKALYGCTPSEWRLGRAGGDGVTPGDHQTGRAELMRAMHRTLHSS